MLLAADWALARLLATVLSLRLWADMAEPAMSKMLSIDITPLPEWHCPGWQSGRSETESWPDRPGRCDCSGQTPAGFPPCCRRWRAGWAGDSAAPIQRLPPPRRGGPGACVGRSLPVAPGRPAHWQNPDPGP